MAHGKNPTRISLCHETITKQWYILLLQKYHHKFHGSWFGNNSPAKFVFHKFIWNRNKYHSSTCIVWTSMSCAMFKHKCHMLFVLFHHGRCMFICVVYTWKSCT
jgi:hypothetical protein